MKIEHKSKFVKGNIENQSGPKGYIIGQFMAERGFSEQATDEVEVAWKKLTSEDSYKKGHFHKIGVEINIVISGSCSMMVNGESVSLAKGDFLIVYPESVLENFKIDSECEMIIVKAPSVPDDKFNID